MGFQRPLVWRQQNREKQTAAKCSTNDSLLEKNTQCLTGWEEHFVIKHKNTDVQG